MSFLQRSRLFCHWLFFREALWFSVGSSLFSKNKLKPPNFSTLYPILESTVSLLPFLVVTPSSIQRIRYLSHFKLTQALFELTFEEFITIDGALIHPAKALVDALVEICSETGPRFVQCFRDVLGILLRIDHERQVHQILFPVFENTADE